MRKIIAAMLALMALFSLAACGDGNTVTIYLPDKVEVYQADGTLYATITYTYEDGWQNKESFTVAMKSDAEGLGAADLVYSEKKVVQEVGTGAKQEAYYNDEGMAVRTVNTYADGSKQEVHYTLDDRNRVVKEEVKVYAAGAAEPTITTQNYTYTDTDTGSTSTYSVDSVTYVKVFDKNDRQISQTVQMDGKETSRTELTYDAAGNTVSQTVYAGGQKSMEMKFTYKAVKVSAEVAARLPQLKSGK